MARYQTVKPIDYAGMLQGAVGTFQGIQGGMQRQEQHEQKQQMQQAQIDQAEADRKTKSIAEGALEIQGLPYDQKIQKLTERRDLKMMQGRDVGGTQEMINLYASNDPQKMAMADQYAEKAIETGYQAKVMERPKDDRTGLQKDLLSAGLVPGSPEWKAAILKTKTKPGTVISMGVNEEQKQLAKLRAGGYQGIQAKAATAEENIQSLDILDTIDVTTGRAEPMKQAIAGWAQSMGVDASSIANVPAGQAFTAEANKVVLQAMAQQKGPQTESDMKQIRATVSNLKNDPRGNQFINDAARASSKRQIEQRDFMENYLHEKGTLKGGSKSWNDHKRNVPMISKSMRNDKGLPVFYHRFEERVLEANPNASRADVIKEWKRLDKIAAQEQRRTPNPKALPQYLQDSVSPIRVEK